jgi:hypothetical protein
MFAGIKQIGKDFSNSFKNTSNMAGDMFGMGGKAYAGATAMGYGGQIAGYNMSDDGFWNTTGAMMAGGALAWGGGIAGAKAAKKWGTSAMKRATSTHFKVGSYT